jgi:hypothetical protein
VAYKGTLVGEGVHSAVKVFNPQPNFSAACEREAKLLDILHQGTGSSKYLGRILQNLGNRSEFGSEYTGMPDVELIASCQEQSLLWDSFNNNSDH